MSKFWRLALPIYLFGAVLTFGHEAARFTALSKNPVDAAVAGPKGLATAIIWPAYWVFKLSWDTFEALGASHAE